MTATAWRRGANNLRSSASATGSYRMAHTSPRALARSQSAHPAAPNLNLQLGKTSLESWKAACSLIGQTCSAEPSRPSATQTRPLAEPLMSRCQC
eukprot:6700-Chlamydomonas_euryale.AAC.2